MKFSRAYKLLAVGCIALSPLTTVALAECTIGEVKTFAGTYAPRNWAMADGQLLDISSNVTLYSVIGTNYGGDGYSTFALPDLRGRTMVHTGNSNTPGANYIYIGDKGGRSLNFITGQGGTSVQDCQEAPCTTIAPVVDNMQPYLGINHIICIDGIYPSRN